MITRQGQSFFDLVIQGTGAIENAFEMALLNGLSITDDLEIGQTIEPSTITSKSIVAMFSEKHYPATFEVFPKTGELSPVLGGIGYMAIEDTFIVS